VDYKLEQYFSLTPNQPNQPAVNNPRSFTTKRTGWIFSIYLCFGLLWLQYDESERRREMAKNSLERYTHYYERWAANQSVSIECGRSDLKL